MNESVVNMTRVCADFRTITVGAPPRSIAAAGSLSGDGLDSESVTP
jgi:hypothetical protein